MQQQEPDDQPRRGARDDTAHTVVVTVIRSGGIAGRRRQWRAEPAPDDTPRWKTLVDRCPWDDAGGDTAGAADRFVWLIRVADGHIPPREAELPDSRLDGPWRELVEAVRAAASCSERRAWPRPPAATASCPWDCPSAGPPPRASRST